MKKKILIVIGTLGCGGAEKALINMLDMIDYEKYEIYLQLFRNRGLNMDFINPKVTLLPAISDNNYMFLPGKSFLLYSIKNMHYIQILRKALYFTLMKLSPQKSDRFNTLLNWKFLKRVIPKSNESYDVAIGYTQSYPIYYVIDCINAKRKIGWIHTDYSQIHKVSFEYTYFKKMYAIVTVSDKCVDGLTKAFPKLNNIKMISNLNNPRLIWHLASMGQAIEMEDGGNVFKILTIGRIVPLKGYDIAVKAACILKAKGFSFHWYIMGDGPYKEEIHEYIINNSLDNCFSFLGEKTNPYPYILKADVIVQASRYEGKSLVLDEAKILHKLIICTNYSSVTDQIHNEVNGLIVPMSSEGIADGIIRISNEIDLQKKILSNLEDENVPQEDILWKHYQLLEGQIWK